MPEHVTCIAPLNLKRARTTNALIVGMANGEVRVYNEKSLVTTLNIGESVAGAVVSHTVESGRIILSYMPCGCL